MRAPLVALALLSFAAQSQAAPIDQAAKGAVVARLAQLLDHNYVFPEVGKIAGQRLNAAYQTGEYREIGERGRFAERLSRDLGAYTNDVHLRLYDLDGPPPADTEGPDVPREAGIVRADILKGNVGYLRIDAFAEIEAAAPRLDRIMAALAGTSALIVDLRDNDGGSPGSVAYLASFFFKPDSPVHLNDLLWRKPGEARYRTDSFFTQRVPTFYAERPVLVLTSAQTISAGEEFAYDLKVLKRARIVGETTRGGANPGGMERLGSRLLVFMPTGQARNPTTGTNWEGKGVTPDIPATAADALASAFSALGGQSRSRATVDEMTVQAVFRPVGGRTSEAN